MDLNWFIQSLIYGSPVYITLIVVAIVVVFALRGRK